MRSDIHQNIHRRVNEKREVEPLEKNVHTEDDQINFPSHCVWRFERKWPPKGVTLLGGVALLEEVCHCGGGL